RAWAHHLPPRRPPPRTQVWTGACGRFARPSWQSRDVCHLSPEWLGIRTFPLVNVPSCHEVSGTGRRPPHADFSGIACLRLRKCSPSSTADRKSTRLNSSHVSISYAVFCLKKKKNQFCNSNHY